MEKGAFFAALICFLLSVPQTTLAAQREFAEDVAAALCAAVGATTGGNTASAAGAVVCKYAVRLSDSAVSALIDKYFDSQDQKFADKTCSTIVYADGHTIKPAQGTGCN